MGDDEMDDAEIVYLLEVMEPPALYQVAQAEHFPNTGRNEQDSIFRIKNFAGY